MLLGDSTVGQEALLRFYVLHVVVLPLVLTLFVAVHFWRIRKDGGLAKPEGDAAPKRVPVQVEIQDDPALIMKAGSVAIAAPARKFTIQGLVRGPLVKLASSKKTPSSVGRTFLPLKCRAASDHCRRDAVSFFFNAPLEQPVNVMHPPNPAKAPWYFLGLQEQVSYSAFWGGIGVPGIELLLLLLVPYIDRSKEGVGRWFARERIFANSIFLIFVLVNICLIVIGTFFRGANWQFVSPF